MSIKKEEINRLHKLIEDLSKRVEKLENSDIRKRKVPSENYLAKLNSQEKPIITFRDFVQNEIIVTNEHIEILLEKNTYAIAFESVLSSITFGIGAPIKIKNSRVYIFKGEKFDLWSKQDSLFLFENVKVKMLREIQAWKKRNGDIEVDKDDALSIKYNKALMKIFNTNFDADSHLAQRLRSKLTDVWSKE